MSLGALTGVLGGFLTILLGAVTILTKVEVVPEGSYGMRYFMGKVVREKIRRPRKSGLLGIFQMVWRGVLEIDFIVGRFLHLNWFLEKFRLPGRIPPRRQKQYGEILLLGPGPHRFMPGVNKIRLIHVWQRQLNVANKKITLKSGASYFAGVNATFDVLVDVDALDRVFNFWERFDDQLNKFFEGIVLGIGRDFEDGLSTWEMAEKMKDPFIECYTVNGFPVVLKTITIVSWEATQATELMLQFDTKLELLRSRMGLADVQQLPLAAFIAALGNNVGLAETQVVKPGDLGISDEE